MKMAENNRQLRGGLEGPSEKDKYLLKSTFTDNDRKLEAK